LCDVPPWPDQDRLGVDWLLLNDEWLLRVHRLCDDLRLLDIGWLLNVSGLLLDVCRLLNHCWLCHDLVIIVVSSIIDVSGLSDNLGLDDLLLGVHWLGYYSRLLVYRLSYYSWLSDNASTIDGHDTSIAAVPSSTMTIAVAITTAVPIASTTATS
jgi:hypothetical protein